MWTCSDHSEVWILIILKNEGVGNYILCKMGNSNYRAIRAWKCALLNYESAPLNSSRLFIPMIRTPQAESHCKEESRRSSFEDGERFTRIWLDYLAHFNGHMWAHSASTPFEKLEWIYDHINLFYSLSILPQIGIIKHAGQSFVLLVCFRLSLTYPVGALIPLDL